MLLMEFMGGENNGKVVYLLTPQGVEPGPAAQKSHILPTGPPPPPPPQPPCEVNWNFLHFLKSEMPRR